MAIGGTSQISSYPGIPVPAESRAFILKQVKRVILEKGRISYRELLNILLYHPAEGFYTKHLRIGTGAEHHFSTQPIDYSPDYGYAFARQIARSIKKLDAQRLDLVALGDGNGLLLRDVLEKLEGHYPELYARLRKTSLELVERFALEQRARLARFRVEVIKDSALNVEDYFGPVRGVFFAHELIDQLPVHRVVNRAGILKEKYFALQGGKLKEIEGPLSDPEIEKYFKTIGSLPRTGRTCAVNLDALRLLRSLSRILEKGIVFLFDYNGQHPSLHGVKHARFGRHVPLAPQTLEQAVGRDVTTDVDFKALQRMAKYFGFRVLFEGTDTDFLQGGIYLKLLPELGTPMRVLTLTKGL
jgi:SAM-dependent MidA family methyltransferase